MEDRVNRGCEIYAEMREAFVEKTPEPMKVLGKAQKGRFLACFVKSAQPDYKGTIWGGRAFIMEAKHSENRLEFERISGEQRTALDTHRFMGAAAYVLMEFEGRDGGAFLVPWNETRKLMEKGQSCTAKDVGRWRVRSEPGEILFLDKPSGEKVDW